MHYTWLAASILLGRDIERDALSDAQSVGHFIAVWLFHSQHGVYLFFVISGYLITQGLTRKPAQSPLTFLRNRAWRLLPCLWVVLLASIIIGRLNDLPLPSLFSIFANFLTLNWALPKEVAPLLTVTWSLFWEWVFYLCAAVALVGARSAAKSAKVFAAFVIFVIAAAVVICLGGRAWTYLWLFATGSAVACWPHMGQRLLIIRWQFVAVYYLLVVAAYAWIAPAHDATQSSRFASGVTPHDFYVPLFSVAAAWLIVWLRQFDPEQIVSVRLRRSALWLGERSYSIYLWHMPVIFALAGAVARVASISSVPNKVMACASLLGLAIVATIAVSEISYRLLERPYLRRSRSVAA